MKPETKFRLKIYLYYLIIEPWTENISLPNARTIIWISIIIAFLFKIEVLLFSFIILGLIFHLIHEFESGKFIYWYRQKKYKKQRDALKKVREEKKNG